MCTTNFTTTQLQERRKIARIYVLDSINYNISIQHYRFSILISPNSFDLFSIVPFQFFYRPNVLFFTIHIAKIGNGTPKIPMNAHMVLAQP